MFWKLSVKYFWCFCLLPLNSISGVRIVSQYVSCDIILFFYLFLENFPLVCSKLWSFCIWSGVVLQGENGFSTRFYLGLHSEGRGLFTDMISLAGRKGTHYPQTVWSSLFSHLNIFTSLICGTASIDKSGNPTPHFVVKQREKTRTEVQKLIETDSLVKGWLLKAMTSLRLGNMEKTCLGQVVAMRAGRLLSGTFCFLVLKCQSLLFSTQEG